MDRTILGIIGIMCFLAGCSTVQHKEEIVYGDGKIQKFTYMNETAGAKKGETTTAGFMDAIDILRRTDPNALMELGDLPFGTSTLEKRPTHQFTGVIQNKTKYEVSIPSRNSGASLVIPPYGWIEYTAWTSFFSVTAYHDGKPFYCLKINAQPKNYDFMCKKYDFMAEIVKPEPVEKQKPVPKKRRIKKKPKGEEGVQGLG